LAALIGALVLVGWLFDASWLQDLDPRLVAMKPNTALAFMCLGTALVLSREPPICRHGRAVVRLLAGFVGVLASLTLFEYAFARNLGIDELLFAERSAPPGTHAPSRMSLITALNLLLLSVGVQMLSGKAKGRAPLVAQSAAQVAALGSSLVLVGYLFNVPDLYSFTPYASVALHSALAFLLSSIGLFFVRPNQGLSVLLASETSAGLMMRRLTPFAVAAPLTLGWIRLQLQTAGYIGTEVGITLFALSNIVCFTLVIRWTGIALLRMERAQAKAIHALSENELSLAITLHSIGDGVIATDIDGAILRMNAAAEQLTGWQLPDARGQALANVFRLVDEESGSAVETSLVKILRGEGRTDQVEHCHCWRSTGSASRSRRTPARFGIRLGNCAASSWCSRT
jgi:PAS domain S-box-containing protein